MWPRAGIDERRRLGCGSDPWRSRSAARRRSRRSAASGSAPGRGSPAGAAACRRRRPRRRAAGSPASGRACRDAAGSSNSASTGASSTLRPAYMTTTRCGGLGDDAEIVGDQHDGGAGLLLQLEHQVEDLRLDGDVERRGRLVGDQHLRIAATAPWRSSRAGACRRRAGAGYSSSRRLASAMRTRSSISPRALARRPPRHAEMAHDVLGDLRADRQHRIEAGHRLLEDHRDAMAAQALHLLFARAPSAPRPRSGSSPRRCGRSRAGSGAGSRAPSPTCRSPIRPRCPASRRAPASNDTPSTARTTPSSVSNWVCRSRTSRIAFTAVSPAADRAGRAGRRPKGSPPAR